MLEIVWEAIDDNGRIIQLFDPKYVIRILSKDGKHGYGRMTNSILIHDGCIYIYDLMSNGKEEVFYLEDIDHIIIRARKQNVDCS